MTKTRTTIVHVYVLYVNLDTRTSPLTQALTDLERATGAAS